VRIIVRQPHRDSARSRTERSRVFSFSLSLCLSVSLLSFEQATIMARFLPSIVSVECSGMANCAGTKTGFYSRAAWERIILFRRAISRTSARWPLRFGQWLLFEADLRGCCTHVPRKASSDSGGSFREFRSSSRCISKRISIHCARYIGAMKFFKGNFFHVSTN